MRPDQIRKRESMTVTVVVNPSCGQIRHDGIGRGQLRGAVGCGHRKGVRSCSVASLDTGRGVFDHQAPADVVSECGSRFEIALRVGFADTDVVR